MVAAKTSGIGRTTIAAAFAAGCVLSLSACVGGTTYGTGVSQEKQTLTDLYNMFSLKRESRRIDYSPRPDLIIPKDTAALPEPLEESTTTANPQWPETPEQRIARVRAQAGEIDERSGDYDVREQFRQKEGIRVETREIRKEFVAGKTDRDGNPLLNVGPDANARKEVLKAKADLDYSRGVKRKFLTEPPLELRVPVDSAPTGDAAFTEEELAQREKEKLKREHGTRELKPLAPKDD